MDRDEAPDGLCLWGPLEGEHLGHCSPGLPSWAVSFIGTNSLELLSSSVRWLLLTLFIGRKLRYREMKVVGDSEHRKWAA